MRATTDAVLGKGHRLTMKAGLADKGSMVSDLRRSGPRDVRRSERESGQALVEFALILPLFLMIVVGIIQFGVALNFWLDLQRIGNQGARWAAVNCGQSASNPGSDPCIAADGTPDIEEALHDMVISRANDATVEVCWVEATGSPAGTAKAGDAVRVKLKTEYVFLGITGFLNDDAGLSMDLNADATMRLEQAPTSPALAGVSECSP
jgi:hypothetical protein